MALLNMKYGIKVVDVCHKMLAAFALCPNDNQSKQNQEKAENDGTACTFPNDDTCSTENLHQLCILHFYENLNCTIHVPLKTFINCAFL